MSAGGIGGLIAGIGIVVGAAVGIAVKHALGPRVRPYGYWPAPPTVVLLHPTGLDKKRIMEARDFIDNEVLGAVLPTSVVAGIVVCNTLPDTARRVIVFGSGNIADGEAGHFKAILDPERRGLPTIQRVDVAFFALPETIKESHLVEHELLHGLGLDHERTGKLGHVLHPDLHQGGMEFGAVPSALRRSCPYLRR